MTNETEKQKLERLLREAQALQGKSAEGAAKAGKSAANGGGNIVSDMKAVRAAAGTINNVARFCKHVGLTTYRIFKPVFDHVLFPMGRAYGRLWNKFCFKTNKETGEQDLRRGRAATMLLTTVALASALVPGAIGAPARMALTNVLEPVVDGVTMALPGSYNSKETLYLTNSQELQDEANTHSVKGCRSQDCSDGGVYFLVRNSFAHNLWSLATRGNMFYVTDMETATITPGMNKCEVTSYGYRARFFQSIEAYPTILSAKCSPVFNMSTVRQSAPANAPTAAAPAATAAAPTAG